MGNPDGQSFDIGVQRNDPIGDGYLMVGIARAEEVQGGAWTTTACAGWHLAMLQRNQRRPNRVL